MPPCFRFDSEALSYETRTPQAQTAVLALIVPQPASYDGDLLKRQAISHLFPNQLPEGAA